jgi:hypothetical protein
MHQRLTGLLFVIASDAVSFLNSDIRTSLLFMHQRQETLHFYFNVLFITDHLITCPEK